MVEGKRIAHARNEFKTAVYILMQEAEQRLCNSTTFKGRSVSIARRIYAVGIWFAYTSMFASLVHAHWRIESLCETLRDYRGGILSLFVKLYSHFEDLMELFEDSRHEPAEASHRIY